MYHPPFSNHQNSPLLPQSLDGNDNINNHQSKISTSSFDAQYVKAVCSIVHADETTGLPCNVFVFCGADNTQGCKYNNSMIAQPGDCSLKYQVHLNAANPEYFDTNIDDNGAGTNLGSGTLKCTSLGDSLLYFDCCCHTMLGQLHAISLSFQR
jgi:hypothetical protein